MTVKEVLMEVSETLGSIDVPALLIETIGIKIAKSLNGVNLCLDAMNRNEAEQARKEQEKAEQEEPEQKDEQVSGDA